MNRWPYFLVPAFITFGPGFMVLFGRSDYGDSGYLGLFGALSLTAGLALMLRALWTQGRQIEDLRERLRRHGRPD